MRSLKAFHLFQQTSINKEHILAASVMRQIKWRTFETFEITDVLPVMSVLM